MQRAKAIGIDLGTTNSAVAWVDESGHTVMVQNAEGELLTPSIVLFEDSEIVVGKEAKTATIVEPDRVAIWVKRDMGASVYSRPIRGTYLPPEVIQACILRKLKTDATQFVGADFQVIITVPAYFDEPRRKATMDAGQLAGLNVLDIVNEPTASALAFAEVQGYLAMTGGPTEKSNVLVYDLGGGTFDVTLLRLEPGGIRTIATDGDAQLGGVDWDQRLVTYLADEFQKATQSDARRDPHAIARLCSLATETKHTLSARSHASARVEYASRAVDVPVSREQFESMTADLLNRTQHTVEQLLIAAKMQWTDVARILLVGGSTRMPAVQRMLREISGLVPDYAVNPDEAVARGAALYADYLIKRASGVPTRDFEVTNVNAHSLGIEGFEVKTSQKKNVILIPRNTPLPATAGHRFVTKRMGQPSIQIRVLEGESSVPAECTAIGQAIIRDLPPGLPQAWPVEVTFQYGVNGRLSVHAVVPGANRQTELQLERATELSGEGWNRWRDVMDNSVNTQAILAAGLTAPVAAAPEAVSSFSATAVAPVGVPATSVGSLAPSVVSVVPTSAAPASIAGVPVAPGAVALPPPMPGEEGEGEETSPWIRIGIWLLAILLLGLGLGFAMLYWLPSLGGDS